MNKRSRILIAALLLGLATLTGCENSAVVDSTLDVDENFAGQRTVNITVPITSVDEYFNGTEQDLYDFVDENCPEQMSFQFTNTDTEYKYIFTIDFTSLEDYNSKLQAILGDGYSATATFSNTLWASGIDISENFASRDLIRWLEYGLVEDGYVSSENAVYLFEDGLSTLTYDGTTLESPYNYIYIENLESVAVTKICEYTDVVDLDTFNKKIEFTLDSTELGSRKSEIDAFFANCQTNGARYSSEVVDEQTIYTIYNNDMTADELVEFSMSVYNDDANVISLQNADFSRGPASFERSLTEEIDLSQYASIYGKTPDFESYISSSEDISALAKDYSEYPASTDYEGYDIVYTGNDINPKINISLARTYDTESVNVDIKRSYFSDKWEIDARITLLEVPDKQDLAAIEENLNTRLGLSTESSGVKTKLRLKKKDGFLNITIKQSGDTESMTSALESLTGKDAHIEYAGNTGIWRIFKQEDYVINLDYTYLLGQKGLGFDANYNLNLGLSPDAKQATENASIVGGKLNIRSDDGAFIIDYKGTRLDIFSLFFWIVIVALVITVVVLINKLKNKKNTPNESSDSKTPDAPEPPEAPEPPLERLLPSEVEVIEPESENTDSDES